MFGWRNSTHRVLVLVFLCWTVTTIIIFISLDDNTSDQNTSILRKDLFELAEYIRDYKTAAKENGSAVTLIKQMSRTMVQLRRVLEDTAKRIDTIHQLSIQMLAKKQEHVDGTTKFDNSDNESPSVMQIKGVRIDVFMSAFNIGIKHSFSCINIRQVPREVLKTEAEAAVFKTSQGT